MDGSSLPLNARHVLTKELIINRINMFVNGIAIVALFYYRATTLGRIIETRETPLVPYLIVVFSEIMFTFMWILYQAYRWRPVKLEVYPERLTGDEKLPPVDVFVCTADPSKEPSLGVMNTVVSALALDYPPDKLAVYLQDDGGSYVTLNAIREAWKLARFWVPFRRKYELKIACPAAYLLSKESAHENFIGSSEFAAEKKMIEKKYAEFQEALEKNSVNASASVSRDHAPAIEVITDENGDSNLKDIPLLVYTAREKRPAHPHHFKGGALNVLLRVSAVITNAPYFLVLDCDMYCNNPSSARGAMCFYLDPKIAPKIAWVQYPQKFHNLSEYDIYGGSLNAIYKSAIGFDGLQGPNLYGCNFVMTRESIYGIGKIEKDVDLNQLKKTFGSSNEFINSLYKSYIPQLPEHRKPSAELQKELQLLASCTYDNGTDWGEEVGYRYFTVVEDAITSLSLHCKGWISVYIDPASPCFLGATTTNLNDMLVQQTRWAFGLMQIGLSRFNPLIYGPLRMSILESLCYAYNFLESLYVFPVYGLAIIPPICLLYGIPLYPKVSDPYFIVFAFIFLSSRLKHVQETIAFGDLLRNTVYELRIWMMKSVACYFYAILNAILDKIGLHEANFSLTSKVVDDEQETRFRQGIYDFQVSPMLLIPLCSLYILNLGAFIIGMARLFQNNDELLAQAVLSFFVVIVNYHLMEGMFLRKDKGRIAPSVTLLSIAISAIILGCGSLLVFY
ncbi:cellulose synthase-like protein E1 isoform X1 [Sesamum indicum]|uniref:Cellulose synthase-like protein E1 isoform X1 n=1 Tax=Sesamum indicum TaxID=4182 RepID=A0A6I9TVQ6_SESIN|nr:cellulose synthase-like protein E1 isoform X1 [Sesamum indicum]